jgi:hypothetical protein
VTRAWAGELRQNQLIKALLAPNIDLNHDGKPGGLSVGFGLVNVRAKLVR